MRKTRGRWTGSIRFRLTAWYAAIVLAVILALGFTFSTLLERQLRNDVDARIERVARSVKDEIEVVQDPASGQIFGIPPPPDLYTFPSLLIQVVDSSGEIVLSSENLNSRMLPAEDAPEGSADPVFTTATLDGVQVRTVRLPLVVRSSRETVGAVNVGEPLIQLNQTLDHVRRLLLIGATLGVAFAAFSGWFIAGRALRPVDRITAAAADIAEGTGFQAALSRRLSVGRSGDELARLSETFNRMLDRLQRTFESQQRFVADASHELRTPLTAVRGNVEVLSRQMHRGDTDSVELNETLEDLRRESERMSRLVEGLLILARAESVTVDEPRRIPIRLNAVAQEAIRVGRAIVNGQEITLVEDAELAILADHDRMLQVALILIENAIRHTAPNGHIIVRVRLEGGMASLAVSDDGDGIAAEHLPHIFDRFYRADSSRQRGSGGTGLGLAIAKAIVESQNGTIQVESVPGSGATFIVSLPRLIA